MIGEVSFEKCTWNELPWKFEAGTPAIAQGIGLAVAIDYLNTIGLENVQAHEQALVRYALPQLKEVPGIRIFGPEGDRAGVLSFVLEDVHPHDIATFLDQYGVAIRAGHHCAQPLMNILGVPATARASFYLYNDIQDVDQLIEALKKTREFFKK